MLYNDAKVENTFTFYMHSLLPRHVMRIWHDPDAGPQVPSHRIIFDSLTVSHAESREITDTLQWLSDDLERILEKSSEKPLLDLQKKYKR